MTTIRKPWLAALIILPCASVFLEGQNQPAPGTGKTYSVAGKVKHPGTYPLTEPTTVLEAINAAGGLSDTDATDIQVARANHREAFMFLYQNGAKPLQMELQEGDVLTARPAPVRLDHIRLPPSP